MSALISAGSGVLSASWGSASTSATQSITCMAWVMIPNTTPSASGWRDMIVIRPNIFMQTFSDGFTMDFGSANQDHTGSALAINTWYHLAQVVVPTSTTNRQHYGYINGKLNVNSNDTTTFTAYTGIDIGNSNDFGLTFALGGYLRDVRVWNRALNAVEIVQEMKSFNPFNDKSLLLWSPLDDDLFTDRSGNGRVLASSGAPAPSLAVGGGFRGTRSNYVGRRMTGF
jgi:hypothetical protein